MLELLLQDIDEELLDSIIVDSFNWLISEVGDNSVRLNNLNYSKLREPFSKKKELIVKWSYRKKDLDLKRDYLAVMDWKRNEIRLHCNKLHTLQTTLETFFHEYCHSQQSSSLYAYYINKLRINYYEHPLEKEANEFAEKMVPLYWINNSWKF